MSSGLQNYYDSLQEENEDIDIRWSKDQKRIEQVERFKESYKYKRYCELKEMFKEWEEYQNLKNDIDKMNRKLLYDFHNNYDSYGIIE